MNTFHYEEYKSKWTGKVGWKITSCCINEDDEEVILPCLFEEKPILALADFLLEGKYFKRIRLPNELEEIGFRCFKNCVCLEEIRFPKTIKKINGCAFMGCESLRGDIILPLECLHIGQYCFAKCYLIDGYVMLNDDALIKISYNGRDLPTQFEKEIYNKAIFLKPIKMKNDEEILGDVISAYIEEKLKKFKISNIKEENKRFLF